VSVLDLLVEGFVLDELVGVSVLDRLMCGVVGNG